jgi:hypothetical protein
MEKILQERWESRSGKHWVDLYTDRFGATYITPSGGGNLGNLSALEALVKMQERVDSGEFQPDSLKTPMRRTTGR